jgi:hypothetical protein
MIDGLKRFFLLSDWSTTGKGFGQSLFALGKGIGILGRIAVVAILLAVASACFIEPTLLMVVGYGGGALFLLLFVTEALGRMFMLFGNWWVVHSRKHV